MLLYTPIFIAPNYIFVTRPIYVIYIGSNTYQEEENSAVHIWPADGYKGRILLVLERKNHMQALGMTGMSCRRRQAEQAVIGGLFLNLYVQCNM